MTALDWIKAISTKVRRSATARVLEKSKEFALVGRMAFFLLLTGGTATALTCFTRALTIADPNGLDRLAGRFLTLPGMTLWGLHIPNCVTWPLQYAYLILVPRPGVHASQSEALSLVAAGALLLLAVNAATLWRRVPQNGVAAFALVMWAASLFLNLYDLARIASVEITGHPLPVSPLLDLTDRQLRIGQIITSAYVLSLFAALAFNRTRGEIFQPFARIANKVRRGITIRCAILVMLAPWLWNVLAAPIHQITHALNFAQQHSALLEIGFYALLLWIVVLRGIWAHLVGLGDYATLLLRMMPPVTREFMPPILRPHR